jgi:hypothetical protein
MHTLIESTSAPRLLDSNGEILALEIWRPVKHGHPSTRTRLIMVMDDLFDVALQVTDGVFGDGTYAEVNKGTPDPGARQAIRRWRAGGDEDGPMVNEVVEPSDPRLGSDD